MPDDRYRYESLPIPTYEEAIASRPPSRSSYNDTNQTNENAEQEGLLRTGGRNLHDQSHGNYRSATVESERSSYDSSLASLDMNSEEDEELRRDMEEMEVLEPGAERRAQQRVRFTFPKSLSNLRDTISSLNLPSLPSLPSFPTLPSALHEYSSSLASRLPNGCGRFKIPWPILARLIGLFLIISLVYGLVVFRILGARRRFVGQEFNPQSVRNFIQKNINPQNIQQHLWDVTFDDHIAGTKGDFFLAEQIERHFQHNGLDVSREDYEVYLNYPKKNGRKVAIVEPKEMQWEAKLEEDRPRSKSDQHPSMNFHGHSKSGNVKGPIVYANYGSRADFENLKDMGVNTTGSIVLVRYYGTQTDRALKVKAAELAGAVGCLIYSDPAEDGFKKGKPWPEGRWRPAYSVQRGAVTLMSWVVGDVLTPGWASTPKAKRISRDNNPGLVGIPSLPLAWRDAQVLLKALDGKGSKVPDDWVGGVDNMPWFTGGNGSPIVQLKNEQDEVQKQPIRNVIGKIHGVETPDKVIYVGNHRDAWCFGAVDPGSGTAVMMEMVRVFGMLMAQQWRPRRTIIFVSWDAEEYNLSGSTEHVEGRINDIRNNAIAYLNVDSGISGNTFSAMASPLFNRPLLRVLNRVPDPQTNKTMKQLWKENNSKLGGLDADSDYVAFQDLAGCSSIDLRFLGPQHGYPYHSCLDNFNWMHNIGDPQFLYHTALAQIWALLILEISDEPVIAYDFQFYAEEIIRYVEELKKDAKKLSRRDQKKSLLNKLNFNSLEKAGQVFKKNARQFEKWAERWSYDTLPSFAEDHDTRMRRISYNTRMSNFESHLLDIPKYGEKRKGGVPGREQFKHIIFGPQLWSGYAEPYFPHIRDALEAGNVTATQEQIELVASILHHAADKLLH